MRRLEGASEVLAAGLQFGFEAVAQRVADESGEEGLCGMVAKELVDLKVGGGSGGRRSYDSS